MRCHITFSLGLPGRSLAFLCVTWVAVFCAFNNNHREVQTLRSLQQAFGKNPQSLRYTAAMVRAFVNIPHALAKAVSNHVIITPNERLARELRRGFNQHQQQHNRRAWLTPQCLSLNQYLIQQFASWQDDCAEPLQLLTQSALLSRFYQCATPAQRHLATTAAQARELLYRYDIDLALLEHGDDTSQMFVKWARRVAELSSDQELYQSQLAKFLTTQNKLPDQPLLLIAFDHLTVTERLYLEVANSEHGVYRWSAQQQIVDLETTAVAPSERGDNQCATTTDKPNFFGFDSLADEFAAAAGWAAEVCRQQPEARVAVVVPQLTKHYLRVQRQFSVTFDPKQGSATRCFDLAGGTPLNTQPAWVHALCFLRWCHSPADRGELTTIAFSDFLTAPWCRSVLRDWTPGQRNVALSHCTQDPSAKPLLELLGRAPAQASFAFWLQHIEALLNMVEWPRLSNLESSQYQAVAQIRETIASLTRQADLDDRAKSSSPQSSDFAAALELLEMQLQSKVFAPQRPASQVQILGLLETTGLDYSHLWVCGMDANNFPQGAQHNPFIPIRIAHQHGLPRITASQELAFSERMLGQWLHSGAKVNFSFVRMQDAYATLPSLPILQVTAAPATLDMPGQTVLSRFHPFFQRQGVALQQYRDWHGVPLPDGHTQGGTGILQDQLECPFRAYAKHRLELRQEREPSEFPDALERGLVLHNIMQRLCEQNQTSQELLQLTTGDIYATCQQVLIQRRPLPRAFVENECRRLTALIEQWMQIEAKRFAFTLHAIEQDYQLQLSKLTFTLRVDRIDRTAGTLSVFDYKSSGRSIAGASNQPPTDIQLPIYSLLDANISNVVYACIGDKDIKAVGLGEQPLDATNKQNLKIQAPSLSWDEQRAQWRHDLSELADAVQQGDARVTPKKNACRHCHLQGLCRVSAVAIDDTADDLS